MEKASKVFKEMEANECEPNAITYHHLALIKLFNSWFDKGSIEDYEYGRGVTFHRRRSKTMVEDCSHAT